MASTLTSPHGTVRFVIVYNDDPDGGLITMMPRHDDEGDGGHDLYKDVGLLFVGLATGMGESAPVALHFPLFIVYHLQPTAKSDW